MRKARRVLMKEEAIAEKWQEENGGRKRKCKGRGRNMEEVKREKKMQNGRMGRKR